MEETDFSKNFFSAILFTLIAGLSTGIGGLLVIGYGKPTFTKLGHMLSFSAGVMIFISFMDLMPEAVQHVGYVTANAWMFGGMALFALVAQFVPEPDVSGLISDEEIKKQAGDKKKKDDEPAKAKKSDDKEKDAKNNKKTEKPKVEEEKKKPKEEDSPSLGHGHSHGGPAPTQKDSAQERKYLMSIGIITALGISLHNFPEGIAVYLACLRGLEVGLPLTFAIAAHNIPEGMAVASPIYHSTGSKWLAFKYSLLSGLCEPIGALVVGALFHSFLTDYIVHCMLAAVAGIMILISIKELIPTTLRYIPAESAAISHVLGMLVVMVGVHWLHGSLAEFHGHGHGHDGGHGHSHSGGIHEEVALRLDETGVAWELPPTPRPGSHHGHSHGGADHGHSHGGHGHSHEGHGHSHGGHGHSHGGHGHSHGGHGHSHF